jgi:hypothetical protein
MEGGELKFNGTGGTRYTAWFIQGLNGCEWCIERQWEMDKRNY